MAEHSIDSTPPQDAHSEAEPNPKKAKVDEASDNVQILTFCPAQQKNVKLQLLTSNTVLDLVSILCDNVSIGEHDNETAYDHMWYIKYKGNAYESGDVECESPLRANETQLKDLQLDVSSPTITLEYDYGASLTYSILFLGAEELIVSDGETREDILKLYPRRKPTSPPTGYTKYVPTDTSINLDTEFSHLQKWIFESFSATLHFFQPGKKKNWGFFEKGGAMMYLPVKPDNLNRYLSYYDQGATCVRRGMEEGGDGCPHHDWHSVVVLPTSKLTQALERKYSMNTQAGFCDCVHANDGHENTDLDSVFPKLSALAGWKKDAKVSKGWMTFVKKGDKCSITVCKGESQYHKNNAPKGTAFDGDKQHDPKDGPYLSIDMVEIKGLQDLFCAAEGLLRTL